MTQLRYQTNKQNPDLEIVEQVHVGIISGDFATDLDDPDQQTMEWGRVYCNFDVEFGAGFRSNQTANARQYANEKKRKKLETKRVVEHRSDLQ